MGCRRLGWCDMLAGARLAVAGVVFTRRRGLCHHGRLHDDDNRARGSSGACRRFGDDRTGGRTGSDGRWGRGNNDGRRGPRLRNNLARRGTAQLWRGFR